MIVNEMLYSEFKKGVDQIIAICDEKYPNRVKVKQEFSNTAYGIEHIADVVFVHLINEDFYGYVFSLTIKDDRAKALKSVELSVIRSDGPIIVLKQIDIDSTFGEGIIEEVRNCIDLQVNTVLRVVDEELASFI